MPTIGLSATQTLLDHWWAILAWYLLWSIASGTLFIVDKRRAARNARRIPESTLHLLELPGGWSGTLVVGHVIRHKTRDRAYRLARAAIIALHAIAWVALLWLSRSS
ncbi:MAG: DUF1294 domain-containing protein [Phycisphaerales bacterium JB043]